VNEEITGEVGTKKLEALINSIEEEPTEKE
jgi:hypothetical protein